MADEPGRSEARKAEPCTNCGQNKYQIENGLRICRNCGVQAEGFVQYDMGDEADAGLMGKVSRQKKAKHKKESRHLSGPKGKSLYLEALQLVLRHQLRWLIREKGHIPELDTVVRDLWSARIAGFPDEADDPSAEQTQLFSSSGFSSGGEEDTDKVKREPRAKSWDPESSSQWPAPSMIDTLAFCYLGCLLLRLPTSIADFYCWANSGNIPFRAVYHSIPQEMQDRMPAEFTKQLKRPARQQLAETTLHFAVFDLVCSYHLNYSMIFPAPNASTTLIRFAQTLALPIETAVVAMHLSTILNLSYHFPIRKTRVHIVDHPEMQMIAVLVVAAKLCYPLDGTTAVLSWIQSIPRLDWIKWKTSYDEHTPELPSPENEKYEGITATQVAAMTAQELDEYLAYLAGRYDHRNDSTITSFFHKPVVPDPAPPARELSPEERMQRAETIILDATAGLPGPAVPEPSDAVSGAQYVSFNNVESLSETVRSLYKAAAEVVGTSLPELTRAVRMLENKMVIWGRGSRRNEAEEGVDADEGALVVDL